MPHMWRNTRPLKYEFVTVPISARGPTPRGSRWQVHNPLSWTLFWSPPSPPPSSFLLPRWWLNIRQIIKHSLTIIRPKYAFTAFDLKSKLRITDLPCNKKASMDSMALQAAWLYSRHSIAPLQLSLDLRWGAPPGPTYTHLVTENVPA